MGLSRQSRELMHKIYAKINGLANPWVSKTSKSKHIEIKMPSNVTPKKVVKAPKKIQKVTKPIVKKTIKTIKPIKTNNIKTTKVVKVTKHKK